MPLKQPKRISDKPTPAAPIENVFDAAAASKLTADSKKGLNELPSIILMIEYAAKNQKNKIEVTIISEEVVDELRRRKFSVVAAYQTWDGKKKSRGTTYFISWP